MCDNVIIKLVLGINELQELSRIKISLSFIESVQMEGQMDIAHMLTP